MHGYKLVTYPDFPTFVFVRKQILFSYDVHFDIVVCVAVEEN